MPSNIIEENLVSFTHVLASKSHPKEDPFLVKAKTDKYEQVIWFKTEPLTREFCYRVAQIQLWTTSQDQGFCDDRSQGIWSYFDVAILENSDATKPKVKDGKELAWHSHHNRLGWDGPSKAFGVVFDRRRDLLDDLEPGNVIAVRACARFPDWKNIAWHGQLIAKVLKHDLFSPDAWTLAPVNKSVAADETTIDRWVYTATAINDCDVEAKDDNLASKIWFTSPVINQEFVKSIEEVELFTTTRDAAYVEHPDNPPYPETSNWSWFDLMILNSREDTTPKVYNGRSLVWSSHSNGRPVKSAKVEKFSNVPAAGFIFDKNHELLCLLEPGNVIAVRVCAQFKGWQTHAQSGRLVVRMSKNIERKPHLVEDDLLPYLENKVKIQEALFSDLPPEYSKIELEPLRADQPTGKGERPLRLLSLDGGGVRGVSELSILKAILAKVAGVTEAEAKHIKPCDYFDMIAGTSTGGLIAIMLGRLHMTIGEVEREYYDLASKVFKNNGDYSLKKVTSVFTGARYSATEFENCIREILKKRSEVHDENAMLYEENGRCKVFVTATDKDRINNSPANRLRTYKVDGIAPLHPDCKIWEAARATSAAPHYFKPIEINGISYIDGGLKANNPTLQLLLEVYECYGPMRPIECLLTIGTGISPNVEIGDATAGDGIDFVKGLIADASACEVVHAEAQTLINVYENKSDKNRYHRFNFASTEDWTETVKHWYGNREKRHVVNPGDYADIIIGLDAWQEMGNFVKMTEDYMKKQMARVEKCAGRLTLRKA